MQADSIKNHSKKQAIKVISGKVRIIRAVLWWIVVECSARRTKANKDKGNIEPLEQQKQLLINELSQFDLQYLLYRKGWKVKPLPRSKRGGFICFLCKRYFKNWEWKKMYFQRIYLHNQIVIFKICCMFGGQ